MTITASNVFILTQNDTCGTLLFEHMLGPTEYAMSYTIAEYEMEKFMYCDIKEEMSFATQIPIQNMDFDNFRDHVNLYVTVRHPYDGSYC